MGDIRPDSFWNYKTKFETPGMFNQYIAEGSINCANIEDEIPRTA